MPSDGTAMPASGGRSAPRAQTAADPVADACASFVRQLTAHDALGVAREVWEAALCAQVDPEIFFPETGQPSRPAREVCAACPVRTPCLEVFGDLVQYGVVGGLSVRERRARRVSRRGGAAA